MKISFFSAKCYVWEEKQKQKTETYSEMKVGASVDWNWENISLEGDGGEWKKLKRSTENRDQWVHKSFKIEIIFH